MPIRVYDKYLDLQGESDAYESLQFNRNYHGVGDFELRINSYMHHADRFQKGSIITLNKQGNKAGVILSKEIELDESGKGSETLILTGDTLDGLMNRRVTVPPEGTSHDRKSGPAETVMKHYVYNNFVVPADVNRVFNRLKIADSLGRGGHVDWESRYKVVGEELEEISKETNLGWGVFVDIKSKTLIFDCFTSKDLTQINAEGNDPVFFSPEFETVKSQEFIDSDIEYRNVGYVGGQGEGEDRKIVEIGESSGWDRIETFIDARDVDNKDDDNNEIPDEEVTEKLIKRGKKKMSDMETVFSLEAEILTPVTRKSYEYKHDGYLHPAQPSGHYVAKDKQVTPFQYEKDFDLGDLVQIVNKSWGLTMTAPITEFLEVHEPGGFRLEATFGEARPTLVTKLTERFNELEGIEKQEYPSRVAVENLGEAKKHADKKAQETKEYADDQDEVYQERAETYARDRASEALQDAVDEAVRKDDLVRQDAQDYANEAEENAKSASVAREEYNERVEEIRRDIEDNAGKYEEHDGKFESIESRIDSTDEKIEQRVTLTEFNEAEGRITDAEGSIETLAGEVSLKVSQDDFNNVEGRVSEAESELKLLPGEIDAKVEKDGVIGAINATPEELLIDFSRVKMEGALEARHIKSLKGLNVGDQFVVDEEGNVTFSGNLTGASGTFSGRLEAREGFFGDNIRLRDGKMEIVRPDGAVSMSDGLVRGSQAVGGIDPMMMGNEIQGSGSNVYKGNAFKVLAGYYDNHAGYLDGRESGYSDVRDSDYRSSVRIQRYYFVQMARYFVLTYRSKKGNEPSHNGGDLHEHLALIYDESDNKLVDHTVETNTTETVDLVVDLGEPDYKNKWLDFRIGWASSWGSGGDHIRFRINNVIQTDYLD